MRKKAWEVTGSSLSRNCRKNSPSISHTAASFSFASICRVGKAWFCRATVRGKVLAAPKLYLGYPTHGPKVLRDDARTIGDEECTMTGALSHMTGGGLDDVNGHRVFAILSERRQCCRRTVPWKQGDSSLYAFPCTSSLDDWWLVHTWRFPKMISIAWFLSSHCCRGLWLSRYPNLRPRSGWDNFVHLSATIRVSSGHIDRHTTCAAWFCSFQAGGDQVPVVLVTGDTAGELCYSWAFAPRLRPTS